MTEQIALLEGLLGGLRAAAELSRLRLLAICAQGEWTVSELTQVMGQSQPRISRHLKLLAEAGLLERIPEGSWVFYRIAQSGEGAAMARALCRLLPERDAQLTLDRHRLAAVRESRRRQAEQYFDARAHHWDSERELGVDVARVEAELARQFEQETVPSLLDIGTGTGRVLQILARHIGSGLGVDLSRDMLAVARANLDRGTTRNCQVRQADMYHLPLPNQAFAAVTLHQVLHYADDPLAVLAEARRVLQPRGRLLVVDLAQHEEERLRSERQHRRLGFGDAEMARWFGELGMVEESVARFPGERLTVVMWVARVPGQTLGGEGREQRSKAA
ncbi:metalloregulator ArsR/SmtB family transcription factor [Geminicoccaceae bacterium 1502E]|uniref:Metalloregulator ArsR/SmtB family transcription factor n=1 Tax=Marinimicrococcus flavescens TaxID=3031815 RepID=A0AAP3XSQ9_9PROT|nr:metalloregulator ArsR/SmtB family transcription factor [Marinimicrococcus flavescens]MDX6752612.1 metalloregulator ArsR/SmtB family transcription factor [Geminicoccaceae bacterium 1502E]